MSRRAWVWGAICLIAIFLSFISGREPAQAQCGSSVSSCKSCHEVQGQAPVNSVGEWHQAHAFGDFCEFCHAGNVQAREKEAAHQGLVAPLDDVKASCQSCHPTDYEARAQKYAAVLGISLGAGGGAAGGDVEKPASPAGGAPAVAGASSAGAASDATLAQPVTSAVAVPSGGEVIDFNRLLIESAVEEPAISTGDLVLIILIVFMAFVFWGLVWRFERVPQRLAAWWQANLAPALQPAAAGALGGALPVGGTTIIETTPTTEARDWPRLLADRPELARALAALAAADRATVDATIKLLNDRPLGPRALKALARLDLGLLSALARLNAQEVELLIALHKELK